jgi:hypothetical protein
MEWAEAHPDPGSVTGCRQDAPRLRSGARVASVPASCRGHAGSSSSVGQPDAGVQSAVRVMGERRARARAGSRQRGTLTGRRDRPPGAVHADPRARVLPDRSIQAEDLKRGARIWLCGIGPSRRCRDDAFVRREVALGTHGARRREWRTQGGRFRVPEPPGRRGLDRMAGTCVNGGIRFAESSGSLRQWSSRFRRMATCSWRIHRCPLNDFSVEVAMQRARAAVLAVLESEFICLRFAAGAVR